VKVGRYHGVMTLKLHAIDGLTRRPFQASTTHDMDMEMKHSLTPVMAGINDGSVPFGESQPRGDLRYLQQ